MRNKFVVLKLIEFLKQRYGKDIKNFHSSNRGVFRVLITTILKGKIPKTREELMELPGVGFKTADIVLMYGYGIPSIAIDTHCNRVPKRIGLVDKKANVEEVKRTLESLIPKKDWYIVNLGLVRFGQETCRPINPRCEICPMSGFCDYFLNV